MNPEAHRAVPLVVDVDRTLLATDLLWEGLVRVLFERPHRFPAVAFSLARGKAAFKARVAEEAALDLSTVPLRDAVVRRLDAAREAGRPVILASAAHATQVEALAERVGADAVIASSASENLRGERKLERVQGRTERFDYVGDAAEDAPLFRAARRGLLVEPGPRARRRLGDAVSRGDLEVLRSRPGERLRALVRALRPHQWAKNALLVLPLLAAHLAWTWSVVLEVAAGFAAFSLLASAVYLLNDLADLPADRAHPTKRHRALASGALSIRAGVATSVVLAAASVLLALRLPPAFGVVLATYLALNLGYSWGLKRLVVLDVVLLAALYTVRVVAGAALAEIALTDWFLAFSIFFFLSLAVLKRVVELENREGEQLATTTHRPYRSEDLPVLRTVGPAAGVMSALVYCLYITGPIRELYGQPQLLWAGLPLFLYWIVRVWLLALRGEVAEDPVVWVLRDGPSYLVLASFLAVVYAAG